MNGARVDSEATAPAIVWILVIGLLPGTMLLLWLASSVLPADSAFADWLARNGTSLFIAAGVATGAVLLWAANTYEGF